MNTNEKTILIITNDAGVTEYLAYMIIEEYSKLKYNIFCFRNSPASKIFTKLELRFTVISTLNEITQYININKPNTIIYGTGWQVDFSQYVKDISNQYNIKSIALIDHWTNYKERFQKDCLPPEIIVMDNFAYTLAKQVFHNTVHITQKKNYFLESIIKSFKSLQNKTLNHIVFISEPTEVIAKKDTGTKLGFGFSEYSVVEELIQNFDNIIIRLHPADNEKKYNDIILNYPDKKIQIIKPYEEELIVTLSKSKLTIGFDGMALYISYILEINTISYMPNSNRNLTIPLPKQYLIDNINDLKCIL